MRYLLLLVLVAMLVAAFTVLPIRAQSPAQFKVVNVVSVSSEIEKTANTLSAQGWILAEAMFEPSGIGHVFLIFRR